MPKTKEAMIQSYKSTIEHWKRVAKYNNENAIQKEKEGNMHGAAICYGKSRAALERAERANEGLKRYMAENS